MLSVMVLYLNLKNATIRNDLENEDRKENLGIKF